MNVFDAFAKPHKKQQQKVTVKFGNEVFVFTHNTVIEAGWKSQKEEATTVSWQEQMSVKTNIQYSKGTNDAAETIE